MQGKIDEINKNLKDLGDFSKGLNDTMNQLHGLFPSSPPVGVRVNGYTATIYRQTNGAIRMEFPIAKEAEEVFAALASGDAVIVDNKKTWYKKWFRL